MRSVFSLCFVFVIGAMSGCSGCGTAIGSGEDPDMGIDAQFGQLCGTTYCAQGLVCKHDMCVPNLGTCTSNDSCPGDSYCDADGTCVPYGVPADHINDPTCTRDTTLPTVVPTMQCEWKAPPAGDASAGFVNIYSTPVVAELNLDHDPLRIQPSVVAITFNSNIGGERRGMLRVWDGRTCAEQMNIGRALGPDADTAEPSYGSQLAIGDLDGDVRQSGTQMLGHPEIVTLHRTPPVGAGAAQAEVIAYRIVETPTVHLERAWLGRVCGMTGDTPFAFGSTTSNYGPSIVDLDDDGKPEVLLDQYVFDSNGCVQNPTATLTQYITHGLMAVAVDVDRDNRPDLVRADGIYGWNMTTKKWELKPYWQPAAGTKFPLGNVAVADFGDYPTPAGTPAGTKVPEIVVVSAADPTVFQPNSTGTVRVQTITGQIVYGPVPLYADAGQPGGHGGPPTASDFDGDGQLEFAAAANQYYTVYDPDCLGAGAGAARPGGVCNRAAGTSYPDGVLWGKQSQDFSSSITGSSVFDFNGDGPAEVIYRDECYLRVYRGSDGKVLFSSPASSGTGYEEPVIVDVDGDFATEIVVARADNGSTCPAQDPLLPDPNVTWSKSTGFVILRDPEDRWVSSRPIWNQNAYSITNVNADGTIPRSSMTARNWETPGLNNFRQNTQGMLGRGNIADLTVSLANTSGLCDGAMGAVSLSARVCNRGTDAVADGAPVQFSVPDGTSTVPLCNAATPQFLRPGECVTVSCSANLTSQQSRQVMVTVDPVGTIADCHPGNNVGVIPSAYCSG